jgi:hypothetical protein
LDLDGVGNASDNCPEAANPGQEDADEDGIGNVCEPGPHERSFKTFAVRSGNGRLAVPDGFTSCKSFMSVKIQRWATLYDKKGRVIGRGWVKVAGDKTDGLGAFDAAMPKKSGKYRALAPKALLTIDGAEHICLKSVSAAKSK